MRYKDFIIPAGVSLLPEFHHTPHLTIQASVGMTPWLLNLDPTIFPEPTKFSPERWLDLRTSKKLDKYMVAFSRGTRICLGIKYVLLSLNDAQTDVRLS